MDFARISQDGQITIPAGIRRQLDLNADAEVIFTLNGDGEVVFSKAPSDALMKAQTAFKGAAEKMCISDEADVQALVDSVRRDLSLVL